MTARIRADQLPARIRDQLGLPAKAGRRPAGRSKTSGGRWTCAYCALELSKWVDVEWHRDQSGHARFEIPLGA